jgi:hypothetical protein
MKNLLGLLLMLTLLLPMQTYSKSPTTMLQNRKYSPQSFAKIAKDYYGASSVLEVQKALNDKAKSKILKEDNSLGNLTYRAMYYDILKVEDLQNFAGHFFPQAHPKKQIILHHSAGWDNARGMFDWWKNDGVVHVATAIGIVDDGTVFRGYDEAFWAHQIGMKHVNNTMLNQQSVAVEICNWGNLTEKNGKLYSWTNVEIPRTKAIELNYKGSKFYEIYTDAEIEALKRWCLLMSLRFDIDLTYRHNDLWEVSDRAIAGTNGLYTHNSYLSWKTDISPQPKMIEMLKSLST